MYGQIAKANYIMVVSCNLEKPILCPGIGQNKLEIFENVSFSKFKV